MTNNMRDGRPVWTDVIVTDVERSQRFYAELLGWRFDESQVEGYNVANHDSHAVAGLYPGVMTGGGAPCVWDVHLRVADVDALVARVPELGGTWCHEPMDAPEVGRMAYIAAPSGARLVLFNPTPPEGGLEGPGAYAREFGHLCWVEVKSTEHEADVRFLTELLGLEAETFAGGGPAYTVLKIDGEQVFGVCTDSPAAVRPYFLVPQTDAAVRRVRESGGDVLTEPFDSPFGRLAFVTGPDGEEFAVIQPVAG